MSNEGRGRADTRAWIGAALDEITPSAPPVAAVLRKGHAMRIRRRMLVAAGLAVAVAAAVVVPTLAHDLRHQGRPNPVTGSPKVTVGRVGPGAPHGLIARGTIDGKRWTIRLSMMGKNLCIDASGGLGFGCQPPDQYLTSGIPASVGGVGDRARFAITGVIAANVRMVSIALSDGVVLPLRPVRFGHERWIGVTVPATLGVARMTAYSAHGEIAYAIPFNSGTGPSFQDWIRPGQPVPGRVTRVIGAGTLAGRPWKVTVHAGPWGLCAVPVIPGASGTSCWSANISKVGALETLAVGHRLWWTVAQARPAVSYLTVTMAGGASLRLPVVDVAGMRLFVIVETSRPHIRSWGAYDAAGHRLYGGTGTPGWALR